jgi:hypothetical protein
MIFQKVPVTQQQELLMQHFRNKFEELAEDIKNKVVLSRGKSSCMTKLEEAMFWLAKAVTGNDE